MFRESSVQHHTPLPAFVFAVSLFMHKPLVYTANYLFICASPSITCRMVALGMFLHSMNTLIEFYRSVASRVVLTMTPSLNPLYQLLGFWGFGPSVALVSRPLH